MTIPAVLRQFPGGCAIRVREDLDHVVFLPGMAGIQEISASIGRVTGMGIAANIRPLIAAPPDACVFGSNRYDRYLKWIG
jgi:hypothetical protein